MSRSPGKIEEYRLARKHPKGPVKKLYSIKEAAYYLGRTVDSMREVMWAGKIPYVQERERGRVFFDVKDLDAFIERNKQRFTY